MSGGGVPYHLRANKAVDRQLFIEALSKASRLFDLSEYAYATLGGPYLEDLKLIHSHFGITKLLSFEADPIVYQRQEFNKPLSLIHCFKGTTGDFITDFDLYGELFTAGKWVIWLDYASASERDAQLGELGALVGKLSRGDVLKITMNCSPHTLAPRDSFKYLEDFQRAALDALEKQLGTYYPSGFTYKDLTADGMARILSEAIHQSVISGLRSRTDLKFQPITSFRYSDSMHQMLTLTGVLLEESEVADFLIETGIDGWDMATPTWGVAQEIFVPDLSIKEKMRIDELLFSGSAENVHGKLPFRFHRNASKSQKVLNDYISHYRRYPSYLRVLV